MRNHVRRSVQHVCVHCHLGASRPFSTKLYKCKTSALRKSGLLIHVIQLPGRTRSLTSTIPSEIREPALQARTQAVQTPSTFIFQSRTQIRKFSSPSRDTYDDTDSNDPLELKAAEVKRLDIVARLRQRLQGGLTAIPEISNEKNGAHGLPLEDVVKALPADGIFAEETLILNEVRKVYAGKSYSEVEKDLDKIIAHRKRGRRTVLDDREKNVLRSLGVVLSEEPALAQTEPPITKYRLEAKKKQPLNPIKAKAATRTVRSKGASTHASKQTAQRKPRVRSSSNTIQKVLSSTSTDKTHVATLDSRSLVLTPMKQKEEPYVPELSFDLSRVLFNSGVYELQDSRSRVFNFDPYLAQPMPISEFNFEALNAYVTSSKDQALLNIALAEKRRYIGSSSSMSQTLCHFHYLLSEWRDLNTSTLSRGFEQPRADFTVIQRAPAAIFLRHTPAGVYAVDADKEYDEPNVLMSLGKSLEKLLTLEKEEYEKWRRTGTAADKQFFDTHAEAFHYSTMGEFLLRSQLDAKDSRLPGSGVFDLKTRAVAAIRMNVRSYEEGTGYQIKHRHGTWESYEREYYDMARAAFLKYSMQVRMGNMDGIFVAYHNIKRIFGFQYIPLEELDNIIHGQRDRTLGDQEFRLSIKLLEEVFAKVTASFPGQTIRFHFETKVATTTQPAHMHIFAEPMSDAMANEIQAKKDRLFDVYEKELAATTVKGNAATMVSDHAPAVTEFAQKESSDLKTEISSNLSLDQSSDTSDADVAFVDKMFQKIAPEAEEPKENPLLAFKLTIQNKISGKVVTRPDQLTSKDQWLVDYRLEELEESIGRRHYVFCKNRRMAALSQEVRKQFGLISALRRMSAVGAEWRKEQDEIDANRGQTVLYPTPSPVHEP